MTRSPQSSPRSSPDHVENDDTDDEGPGRVTPLFCGSLNVYKDAKISDEQRKRMRIIAIALGVVTTVEIALIIVSRTQIAGPETAKSDSYLAIILPPFVILGAWVSKAQTGLSVSAALATFGVLAAIAGAIGDGKDANYLHTAIGCLGEGATSTSSDAFVEITENISSEYLKRIDGCFAYYQEKDGLDAGVPSGWCVCANTQPKGNNEHNKQGEYCEYFVLFNGKTYGQHCDLLTTHSHVLSASSFVCSFLALMLMWFVIDVVRIIKAKAVEIDQLSRKEYGRRKVALSGKQKKPGQNPNEI